MKKKIVILSAFATPLRSGAEACSEEVPAVLHDRYDFTIVTARMRRHLPRKDVLPGGVCVLRVGLGCTFDKWLFPFLAPLAAARLRPDIVHAVLESFAGAALILCRFIVPNAKRMLTCQSTNTHFLVRSMHRSADAVTVISSTLRQRAHRFGRDDVTVIPNGLSLKDMHSAEKVPGRILFVGRHENMKGIDTLLRAFAAVQHPQAHLRLVGDGSQKGVYEKLAQELGLVERVKFVGFVPVPDVYQEFAEAEIFCGLSRSEALGNVFLEAQATGCAVIGTNVQGIPDSIHDGKNGILVEQDNVEQATRALNKLLGDASLRTALAAAGMQNAAKYDWSRIGEKYAHVYDSLLAMAE
ncbi:hypothetical protein COU76_03850 [Candidatus Peregrinibacteria bacterium CG10_big_fil_rev_8_21_14_0_10_49_10]|nr:MAG: hypothetical protein COU76_03850 [Candidatus Peregrinibacteria bacterium CG10_big_fil_rev_8_21_14_0_10_49_10]